MAHVKEATKRLYNTCVKTNNLLLELTKGNQRLAMCEKTHTGGRGRTLGVSDRAGVMASPRNSSELHNMDYELIELGVHGDKNGLLVALEEGSPISFPVRRAFYIWGTARNAVRGCHVHHRCHEMIMCLSGSCDFLLDDGKTKETVHMDSPTKGLHIPPHIWRQFTNFSPDCIVLVLASAKYDRSDYIEDYEEFKRISNP